MFFSSDQAIGKLYGTIYSGDGTYIASDLNVFLEGRTNATLHIHSPGGSVMDGNLIYNALKSFSGHLTIIIDGIASSMATIIMLAGDTIKMADNAWIMIHSPSGIVEGTATDLEQNAKVLKAIESQFTKYYMNRTGKTKEEIEQWLTGHDNWFSAEEALSENLIDEIIDPLIQDSDITSFHGLNNVAACLKEFATDNELKARFFKSHNQSKKQNMKLNDNTFTALGISPDAGNEAIEKAVADLVKQKADLQKQVEAHLNEKVQNLIAGALKEGRITGAQKENFEALAKQNFDLAKETLQAMAEKGAIETEDGKPLEDTEDRTSWTFADWRKKDTEGLIALKEKSPEEYAIIIQKS